MVVIWNYYLTYSMVLDLPSISKEEITSFLGCDIYNVKDIKGKIIKNDMEYKIIKKLNHDKYPENLEEEMRNELSKY